MSPLKCPIGKNTKQIMKTFTLSFTEAELETIANAMEYYMQHDDEKLNTESLFGGLSGADRVNSINNKIDEAFKNQRIGYPYSRAQ